MEKKKKEQLHEHHASVALHGTLNLVARRCLAQMLFAWMFQSALQEAERSATPLFANRHFVALVTVEQQI